MQNGIDARSTRDFDTDSCTQQVQQQVVQLFVFLSIVGGF